MILPKGNFIGIYRGKPSDFFDKVKNGYLRISWKDSEDIYLASLVVKEGKPTMADLEFVKSKKVLKGKDAFDKLLNVEYAVIEVYSVESRDMQYVFSANDETLLIESPKTREHVKTESKEKSEVEESVETDNFEEFVLNIEDNFTGVVKGVGKDRVATVYIKDGELVGAEVSFDNEKFEGVSALYYLEFPAKVIIKELDDVKVSERIKVELTISREDIIRRYGIKLPDEKELEEVLKSLYELSFEEKEGILSKFSKLLFRIKKKSG